MKIEFRLLIFAFGFDADSHVDKCEEQTVCPVLDEEKFHTLASETLLEVLVPIQEMHPTFTKDSTLCPERRSAELDAALMQR